MQGRGSTGSIMRIETLIPNSLATARSTILDAFAELEQETFEALRSCPAMPCHDGATLGQKLEKLAGLKANSLLSKARQKVIVAAAQDAQAMCDVRNDIVHSRMRFVDGHPETAIYLNTRACQQRYPTGRVMSVLEHQQLAKSVSDVTARIKDWRHAPKR